MTSVLQDWVMELPLRHQGVLLTAVRGCDGASKRDVTKVIVSSLRGQFMVPADPREVRRAGSFMNVSEHLTKAMVEFARRHDHYPIHFVMHLIHAAQVFGYKHPILSVRREWGDFYNRMCAKFHMLPEPESVMDHRLTKDRIADDTVVDGCSSNDWEPGQ